MLSQGLETFANRRVLLLQGPVGPFFARLAQDLRQVGAKVHKVNFHAGDWWFYRQDAVWFRGPMSQWPAFLLDCLERWQIDAVLLYGDCRPVHRVAHEVAQAKGIDVGVFEEGYLRPNHITLERNGVNGHSEVTRDPDFYRQLPELPEVPAQNVGNTYWHMVWWGFWYHTIGALGQPFYPHHVHHRALNLLEALVWLRSAWRKHWYARREKAVLPRLLNQWRGRYFVVPLQVHNDTQVQVHSPYAEVDTFVEQVMRSFALYAPRDTALVIKHHPMDRGYRDYTRHIARLANRLGLEGRCFYIHDQHLPTLLDHARGAVVINSTVGLQALRHNVALKVMGEAIYDMPDLTWQGSLDGFWQAAPGAKPDARLLRQFVRYLLHTNQINGSFYRPLAGAGWHSGVVWPAARAPSAQVSEPQVLQVAELMPPQREPEPDMEPARLAA